jgi:tellurite resistance protein TehA-like permease
MGTAVMIAVAALVIVVISKKPVTNTEQLTPALVLPFVGTTTDAVVGALILNYSDFVNARLAIPIIIVSYMLVGIGLLVGLMIYSAYFIRLTNTGLPPPAMSPSLVLLVGPCGQSSAALQLLGKAAMTFFGRYDKGTFLASSTGAILAAMGDMLGLMLTGMGLLFAAFAVYVILEAAVKRQCKYSLLWWSTIFPMATINTAFIAFSESMDSPTFRVLATALLLILLVDYFVNWYVITRDTQVIRLTWVGRLPLETFYKANF